MNTEKYILLIEDSEDDIALTQMVLERNHVLNKLVVARDGQAALDFLFSRGEYADREAALKPSVIILDLKLPCVGGLEVLKQVRLNLNVCRVPIVVLSSSVNQHEIDECHRLGINRYYRKPSSFEQFAKIIQDIKNTWLSEERLEMEKSRKW